MPQAFGLVLAGLAVGLPAAVIASSLLKRFLYGLAPTDPLILTVAATYLPARRASRVDPMMALRSE